MGIPGFQKWLLGNFPQIVKVQGSHFGEEYDHVAFDINQLIHTAARKAGSREGFASIIFREVDQILKNCVPRKSVYFAFDGPGPLAKLATQRKRRNQDKGGYVSDDDDDENSPSKAKSKRKYRVQGFDRLEITPGVETLSFVRDVLEYWAYTRLQNDRKYRNVEVRISGADVPGEGELKLIDFCKSTKVSEDDSIIIVGGDADIVLQALATTRIRDFFVYLRHFGGSKRQRLNYVISVWELSRILEGYFPEQAFGARIDFILISILNGNDYLPKLRGVSLSRLWRRYLLLKTYSKDDNPPLFYRQHLVDADKMTINWLFFYALVHNVGVYVPPVGEKEHVEREKSDKRTNVNGAQSSTGKRRNRKKKQYTIDTDSDLDEEIVYTGNEDGIPMSEFYGSSNQDNTAEPNDEGDEMKDLPNDTTVIREGLYMTNSDGEGLFNEDTDDDKYHIENMITLYGSSSRLYNTERWFRTILWTIHMYIDGYCCDYRFQYGLPYGPSCEAIMEFIDSRSGEPFIIRASVSNIPALLPHEAAMAMLPKRGIHLLPKPLQKIAEDPQISKKIYIGKDMIDVNAMLKAINRIPLSDYEHSELDRLSFGTPLLLRRARRGDGYILSNPIVKKPGDKFAEIKNIPIYRAKVRVTGSPPCYPWPCGSYVNFLDLPYKKVGGSPIYDTKLTKRPPASSEKLVPKSPKSHHPPNGTSRS